MLLWEVKKNHDMKKLGIGMKPLTEEERRNKYAKKMSYVAFASMVVFIIVLLIGSVSNKSRKCAEKQALEQAVCVDCDDKDYVECEVCTARDDLALSTECTVCSEKHRLTDGKCVLCND